MASDEEIREFQLAHRGDVARRAADVFDSLSRGADIDEIRAQLHRIIGTTGAYGLEAESAAAADFHRRLKEGSVDDVSAEIRRLASLFRAVD